MVWPHHMWALKNPTLHRTRLLPDYRRPGVSDFPSLRNPEYDIALFEATPDSRPTSSIPAGYKRAVYGTDHLQTPHTRRGAIQQYTGTSGPFLQASPWGTEKAE